jgi:hypothetical protein
MNAIRVRKRLGGLLGLCVWAIFMSPQGLIAETSTIGINHSPPSAAELPAPGQPIKLTFQLSGTKNFELRVRALVNRDGKFLDVPFPAGSVDLKDSPTFTTTIHAPLQSIGYQFLVYTPDGSVVSSKQYSIQRKCRPNIELTQVPDPLGDDPYLLSTVAEGLEKEVRSYRTVERLLQDLTSRFSELENK